MHGMLHPRWLSRNYLHAYLLASLLLLVVVRPFVSPEGDSFGLIDALLVMTLLTAVSTSAHSWFTRVPAIALGVIAVVTRLISMQADSAMWCTHLFQISMIAFTALSAVLLLLHLFRPEGSITTDTILGAINAYLLIGIGWASGYALLECMVPGSFDFGGRLVDSTHDQFWAFLGFSYTTLTTLGYGNISPTNPRADALANCEAMLGQFYVAILVGRLVALHLDQRRHTRGARDQLSD